MIKPMVNHTAFSMKNSHTGSHYTSTGVILFTSMGQLLFMNKEAQLCIRQLYPLTTRENGTSLIPPDMHSVVRDVTSRLFECEHPKDCESIQAERLLFASDQGVLVRGFCVPDIPIATNSRVLLTVERLHERLGCPDINVQDRYHLTQREQMVIIYLMLGFTNKEIANRLNLSEYTVKEHLKRVMNKTKTTTRTGLLAKMVFPSSGNDGSHVFSNPLEINDSAGVRSKARMVTALS
jgi:DNA-binding CsgD family transcriptional regulator